MSMVGRRPAPRPRRGGPIPGPAPDICGKSPLFFGLAGASRPRRMAAGANPTDWSCTATSHIIPSTQLLPASGAAGGVGTPEVAQKSGTPSPIWPPWGREIAAANSRGARPRGRPRAAGGGPPGRPGSPPCSTIVLPFRSPKSAQKVTFGEFPPSCRVGISTLQRTSRPPFVRSGHPDGGVPRRVSAISPTSSARPRSREHDSPRQRARSERMASSALGTISRSTFAATSNFTMIPVTRPPSGPRGPPHFHK